MNWNFLAGDYLFRLPVAENDQDGLRNLLQAPEVNEHVPQFPVYFPEQMEAEFKRMVERFQAREAAFWLIENKEDKLIARLSIQRINWLHKAASVQWELSELITAENLQEIFTALTNFCRTELGLHRLEMRLRPGFERHDTLLKAVGFEYEGCLPEQLEYQQENVDLAVWGLIL